MAHQPAYRFAQTPIGGHALVFATRFGVLRHLREHADHRVRHVLLLGRCRCLDEIDNGIRRHTLRRVEHEAAALILVAAHFQKSRQRLRLQCRQHA